MYSRCMPTPSFEVSCTRNELIAPGIYQLHLSKPSGFSFEAGHFVLLDVPLLDNPEDIQPRAYSIGSSPNDDELVFAIKLVPDGRMSAYLVEALKPGVTMRMQGPFGKFTLDRETSKDYLFMCTATGIAPFRSHLRTFLVEETDRKIDLFFGLLSEEELFWEDELKAFKDLYSHFNYHICASTPSPEWEGFKGYVQEQAESVISDFSHKQIYLCGSPLMTKAVKEVAIDTWNVPKEDVFMEGFI